MSQQQTLAKTATLEGTSLHTGEKVTLTLKPAPENHGFKFRRIDLADQPFISADADKVQPFVRGGQKVGRNDPCPCGSGKKYKQCHGKLA